LDWTCFLIEQDDESAVVLVQVTAEYAAAGVTAFAHHGAVLAVLDNVIAAAAGVPLFPLPRSVWSRGALPPAHGTAVRRA
jgi:hypothetical protein